MLFRLNVASVSRIIGCRTNFHNGKARRGRWPDNQDQREDRRWTDSVPVGRGWLTKSEIFRSFSRSIRSQSNVSLRVVESGKTVPVTEREIGQF